MTTVLVLAPPGYGAQEPDPVLRELLREAVHESTSFDDRFDADVWLKDMAARLGNQVEDQDEKVLILTQVHHEANRVDLPPEMILAVIDIESAASTRTPCPARAPRV